MGLSVHDPFVDPLGNPLGLERSAGNGSAIGDIVTRLAPPSGQFIEADGRQLSKAMYPKLFAAIGDAYSVADFTAGFTAVTLPSNLAWTSIAYGNGVFVAVASGSATTAVSIDSGATWQAGAMPVSTSWKSVTYGNGLFVAVASSTSIAATSPDGITWTQRALPSSSAWSSVTYGGGVFVTVGNSASTATCAASSPDGVTWTNRTMPAADHWTSVAYGNGVFVSLRKDAAACAYSPDGITWTTRALPVSASWSSVAYGNGMFVAVATNNSTTVAFSPDGKAWVAGGGGMPAVASWNSVVFAAGTFVALASNQAAISTNGVSWQLMVVQPINRSFAASAFAAGVLVGVPSGDNTATRASVFSPTNFNLPKTITLDNRSTAYIKVA